MTSDMSQFARDIVEHKYSKTLPDGSKETWDNISYRVTKNVLRAVDVTMRDKIAQQTKQAISDRKFIPGGRYLYASGMPYHQVQNCLLLRAADSREGWSRLLHNSAMALMTGAGIGINYSDVREEFAPIRKTGGTATGPLALMQIINEAGRGIMQGGSRRCLPADTPVTMADGLRRPICEIQVGDLVQTQYGPKRVSNVFDQGIQPLIKITTKYGSVISTKNHRWFGTSLDRSPRWLNAGSVKPGWKLYYHSMPAQDKPSEVDLDWMYTLGYYLGNGCAYSSNRTHEVTFQLPDAHISDAQVSTLVGGMSRFEANPVQRQGHGKCQELRFRSKSLVPVFQTYKAPNSSFDIPSEVPLKDVKAVSAFLAGWLDADGSYHESTKVRLSNKYPEVLLQIKDLLFSCLGLVSTLTNKGTELVMSAYQTDIFNQTIGVFSHKYEFETVGSIRVPSTIQNVENAGEDHTFDIEVEDVHEFIAYDHISHNSAIWAGLRWNHPDIHKFIRVKDWPEIVRKQKEVDFNFPATLDGTNISVCLDDDFFTAYDDHKDPEHAMAHSVYWATVDRMLRTAEPGFSVDIGENVGEDLRNAPVAGDTMVLTSTGYQPVSDIVGIPTYLWTGYQWAEATFRRTKEMTPTIKVSFTGERSITCDPSHEFFVRRYNGAGKNRSCEIVKVKASQLKIGDYLDTSLPEPEFSKFDNVSYTAGFILGDGSEKDLTLCTHEKKRLAKHMTGLRPGNDSRGYDRFYLEKIAVKGQIPEVACINSFLAGWFDADGSHEKKQNRIRLSGEYSLLIEARRLLESIGILSTISKPIPSGYDGHSDTRNLIIMSSSLSRFAQVIPCKRLQFPMDYVPYRSSELVVKSIEDDVDQDVFCCDVGVEEHSFIAEGVRLSNCTEVTSADDSDICNLGSINLARVETIEEFKELIDLGIHFLLAGTVYSDVPYSDVDLIRTKNRRLGLGLMGIHEWLLKRGKIYGPDEELGEWLKYYTDSTNLARQWAKKYGLSRPVKTRAIAPNGTIGIAAETTTSLEPIFCVALKRRYLKGSVWHYQYVIDPTAKRLIDSGIKPESIEDAYSIDTRRRVEFQSWVQQFVDHGISSTINIPAWGSAMNNEDTVKTFGDMLYANLPKLRGITCYPDGARGGQPLTPVKYSTAIRHVGEELVEESVDVCELTGTGTCGG